MFRNQLPKLSQIATACLPLRMGPLKPPMDTVISRLTMSQFQSTVFIPRSESKREYSSKSNSGSTNFLLGILGGSAFVASPLVLAHLYKDDKEAKEERPKITTNMSEPVPNKNKILIYDDLVKKGVLDYLVTGQPFELTLHGEQLVHPLPLELRLTHEQAKKEIKGLYTSQLYCLAKNYEHGLRGDHLRNWKSSKYGGVFTENHSKLVDILLKYNKVRPEIAIAMASRKTDGEARDGYVTQYKNRPEQNAVVSSIFPLPEPPGPRKGSSIEEINNNTQADALYALFFVNSRPITPPSHDRYKNAELAYLAYDDRVGKGVLTYLVTGQPFELTLHGDQLVHPLPWELRLSDSQAKKEIIWLSTSQLYCLVKNYEHGLRGDHLRNWQSPDKGGDFTENHSKAVDILLKYNKVRPEIAIEMVNGKTDREASDMYVIMYKNKPELASNSIEPIRPAGPR